MRLWREPMSEKYIISIDQSTQGTKAMIFDRKGKMICRRDISHRQIINEKGWVSHDPSEICENTVKAVRMAVKASGIRMADIAGAGISNQRETSMIWEKSTGKPLGLAVVWQCSRGETICRRVEKEGMSGQIYEKTGLKLSPYFPAAKWAWLLENTPGAKALSKVHGLCYGTVDTWLIWQLTGGAVYKTDYSNASRTQLFNIFKLCWDDEICRAFGIDAGDLPQVCDSDSSFGNTDFQGFLDHPIPIHGVLGDSHGALLGQGCQKPGMIKTTYGTGSSIMMNIGEKPMLSSHGVVTSLAWGLHGKIDYVLEGNINYTGAVISWLKDEVGLINSPDETNRWCHDALKDDALYFIPSFTGLGAPYWDTAATGALLGITRTTGKGEIIRACIECIAYQITDVIWAMSQDCGIEVKELRADGGPTKNSYLMQFQSDLLGGNVLVPECETLSGTGAAYAAGLGLGLYDEQIFETLEKKTYRPVMAQAVREKKYRGWKAAVGRILT